MQVARDLHDEVGSLLTALKMDLTQFVTDPIGTSADDGLNHMNELFDRAIDVGRRVTMGLRPGILDDLGLAAAVEWLCQDLSLRQTSPARSSCPSPRSSCRSRLPRRCSALCRKPSRTWSGIRVPHACASASSATTSASRTKAQAWIPPVSKTGRERAPASLPTEEAQVCRSWKDTSGTPEVRDQFLGREEGVRKRSLESPADLGVVQAPDLVGGPRLYKRLRFPESRQPAFLALDEIEGNGEVQTGHVLRPVSSSSLQVLQEG